MPSIHKNILLLLITALIFAASVFIWGAVGLDPQGVEMLLKSYSFAGLWSSFILYFLSGLAIILLLAAAFFLLKLDKNRLAAPKIYYFGAAIFALTLFPPQWIISAGFSGLLLSILALIQNIAGIISVGLLAYAVSILLENRKFPSFKRRLKKLPLPFWSAGLFFAAAIYFIGNATLGSIPHIGDELIQLWGAKALASGHFTFPIPPNIEFFFEPFLIAENGKWFTQYPGGYQMMLVPFVWLNSPALLNPILAGLTLIIFRKILKELNLSPWWGLLFVLSPFVIFMSASQMNHSASLFWGTLGIFAFLKSARSKTGWMLLWGLSAGLMFSVRPFTAVCFHLPLLIIAVRKKIGWGMLAAVLSMAIGSLPYFITNYFTNGSIFTSGYAAAWDGRTGLFFTESPWGPNHTPQFGLVHLLTLLHGLNSRLWEIPIPALIGILFWLAFKPHKWWKEQALFWCGICIVVGYYFYFYVDLTYGPRFAYCAALPLLAISALGFDAFGKMLRNKGWSRNRLNWFFVTSVLLLLLPSALISLPARVKDFSNRYQDIDKSFVKYIESLNLHNAVVLLDDYPSSDRHARLYSLGFTNRQSWFYSWMLSDHAINLALKSLGVSPDSGYGRIRPLSEIGAALNNYWGRPEFFPDLSEDQLKPHLPVEQGWALMSPFIEQNDIIFARDLGAHNAALQKRFPQRIFYRIDLKDGRYFLSKIHY